jgi:hypothetical protein
VTAEDPFDIVNIVGFATPLGVSIAGLNDAVAPAGKPDTLNEIELVNPFAVGVAVI